MKTFINKKVDTPSDTERCRIWRDLQTLRESVGEQRIESFFEENPGRCEAYTLDAAGLTLDFSKNRLDDQVLNRLLALVEVGGMRERRDDLFNGAAVNKTEGRPALHTALRNDCVGLAEAARHDLRDTLRRMDELETRLRSGEWRGYDGARITDVVNIGIGGSDLGPVMACLALTPYASDAVDLHFVSNIDGTHLREQLKRLKPESTLFIVASKSFQTLETRKNALAARRWCLDAGMQVADLARHFVAVSSNVEAACEFGIARENILPMWDWVGGRYSLWSAIGLPIVLKVGMRNFRALLAGAARMDAHFREAEARYNMPVILGVLGVWYSNFFDCAAQVVVPYDHSLHKFPSFLQQLEMESNGKSVRRDGRPVDYHTMGAIFGEAGSNTQHSFHQLLHQGTRLMPVDFIVAIRSHNPLADQHTHLYANCLSQSRALMCGQSLEQVIEELRAKGLDEGEIARLAPHKVIAGNKPSNTLLMEQLTPETLGALIALYEHKVFVQSVIWDINAFDQWGVELGKKLGERVCDCLSRNKGRADFDPSTQRLIERFQQAAKSVR